MELYADQQILVCPETKQPLRLCALAEAETAMGGMATRPACGAPPTGPTSTVLLRADNRRAYPVVDGMPVLLIPEALFPAVEAPTADPNDCLYAEAYQEMAVYNSYATKEAEQITASISFRHLQPILNATVDDVASFPIPRRVWLDAVYDCGAQWDAYRHLAPMTGKRVMQVGGKGLHTVKFLLAGASEGWLITPMIGEARFVLALARAAGVADRLRCAVALGEVLPFVSDSFDVIYSGGCVHHLDTALAMPEFARVLRTGGRFAALDPWRAPLYDLGTRIFGKREAGTTCHPLTTERVAPMAQAFSTSAVIHHGALFRYPLLAADKFGLRTPLSVAWPLNQLDNGICGLIPGLRATGSSVALLGEK